MQTLQEFHNSIAVTPRIRRFRKACLTGFSLLLSIGLLTLSSCGQDRPEDGVSRQDLQRGQNILRDFAATEIRLNPTPAIMFGLEAELPPRAQMTFGDLSQAGLERRRLIRLELQERLRGRPRLPATRQLAHDLEIAAIQLAHLTALEQTGRVDATLSQVEIYSVHPFAGVWRYGPAILTETHRIDSRTDAQAYLLRMRALSDALGDLKRRLRADAEMGLAPPRTLLKTVHDEIELLTTAQSFELDAMVNIFANLAESAASISAGEQAELVAQAQRILRQEIKPAYLALRDEIAQQLELAPARAGLWTQQNGAQLYQALLAFYGAQERNTDFLFSSTGEAVTQNRTDLKTRLESARVELDIAPLASLSTGSLQSGSSEELQPLLGLYSAQGFVQSGQLTGSLTAPDSTELERINPADKITHLSSPSTFWSFYTKHAAPESDLVHQVLSQSGAQTRWRIDTLSTARQLMPFAALNRGSELYQLNARANRSVAEQHLLVFELALAHADVGLHHARWTFEDTVQYLHDTALVSKQTAEQAAQWIAAYPGIELAKYQAWQQIEILAARAKAVMGSSYEEQAFQSVLIEAGPRPLSLIELDVSAWYGQRLRDN